MNTSNSGSHPANGSNSAHSLEIIDSVNALPLGEWNRLVPADFPFLRHEFLNALEQTACVSKSTGWMPQHIVLRNDADSGSAPIAVAPMYVKYHSYGEFIFDWAWARHYERYGVDYYPKVVLQTPFTPLMGPKILTAPGTDEPLSRRVLMQFGRDLVKSQGINSVHWLFVTDDEFDELDASGYMSRAGTIQFVWTNRGYETMDDFLSTLSSRKRKKIRAERRSVAEQGIEIEVAQGDALTPEHWNVFESFYNSTISKYCSFKYLTVDFFKMLGETMPESLVMFLASRNGRYIAASFCLRGTSALYGRYWGSNGDYPNLHFETCYYSAIEYCIERGIETYDAGTRGEHKLQRGFLARLGRSGHLLRHGQFTPAIADFVSAESNEYRKYCDELNANSAYRRN